MHRAHPRQHLDPGPLQYRIEHRALPDQALELPNRLAAHDELTLPPPREPVENPLDRGAETLAFPTDTPDLLVAADPPPVPRDIPLTASTRDGTEMVRAAAGRGAGDSTEPV
jgi:hypothetical protein